MAFKLIDIENWERREFYEHFIGEVVCTSKMIKHEHVPQFCAANCVTSL